MLRRQHVMNIALIVALQSAGASCRQHGVDHRLQPMQNREQWSRENLDVAITGSFCYENAESNCRRYGRLYTWQSARLACRSLGDGWRLPTDGDWRALAQHHGGISEQSDDGGKSAYVALSSGGSAGFNALLGGSFIPGEGFARLQAHGFYWTDSENNQDSAIFYNFGKGGVALHRQSEGNKQMAISVRCIKE
jgi:uncharacterized protein (TIGR02145 family)